MLWNEIKVTVDRKDLETVTDMMTALNLGGLAIEDYSDILEYANELPMELIDEQLLKKDKNVASVSVYLDESMPVSEYIAYIKDRLRELGVEGKISVSGLDDEQFLNAWRQYYKPFKVGKRLVIVPKWEQYEPKASDVILKIDPGLAFGTGSHQTTQLCLEEIEALAKPGMKVLDLGCGSGILSIAALLFGAESAAAIDIDSVAVKTASENAALNGLYPPRYTAYCGNILSDEKARAYIAGKYDLITVNIVADVIIKMAPLIKEYLKSGGTLVASGIIEARLDYTLKALKAEGFEIVKTVLKDGWAAVDAIIS